MWSPNCDDCVDASASCGHARPRSNPPSSTGLGNGQVLRKDRWRDVFGAVGRTSGLSLLWIYQHCLSPLKPSCCRFVPTCSEYARQAVSRFGLVHGSWLTARRLCRCHPFHRGPLCDPVPPARNAAPANPADSAFRGLD